MPIRRDFFLYSESLFPQSLWVTQISRKNELRLNLNSLLSTIPPCLASWSNLLKMHIFMSIVKILIVNLLSTLELYIYTFLRVIQYYKQEDFFIKEEYIIWGYNFVKM